jgi:hypothetical protein
MLWFNLLWTLQQKYPRNWTLHGAQGKIVKVTVRIKDGSRPFSMHNITVSLNAEGQRAFSIDDRHKTGKEVKVHPNTFHGLDRPQATSL